MWIRAALAYRASFLLAVLGSFLASGLDFVAIMIMFSHIEVLGGFTVAEVALLYGATSTSLGLTELLVGNVSRVGARVRDGTMDTLLVRPVPVFLQLAADRFALRRLGRVTQGLLVLAWALYALGPVRAAWSPAQWALLVIMVLSGTAIYGALYALGGAFQFWAQDAAEVQNCFTYGGNTMLQYPPTVFAAELVRGVTFVVPLAFVNWVPASRLLDRESPLGLPGWVDFTSPLVAAAACGVAALVWRIAVNSYRSTGS
ncbi:MULTISPECIES: ABC transporter permease [Streptomyces]|uniref:ABC transporter permease n=1 Tax=Streptomyces TaxID=1883 RepID=UPI000CD54B2F|nr:MULTISPECIES: ABC-2 family transporter protein [Streptomyces]